MGKLERVSAAINPDRRFYILVFIAAVAIIILRRPDAVLNAQFWAEDGASLFADAYNKGIIIPLLSPKVGYLFVFPRIIAAFSQLFPLSYAPLLFNLSAIIIKTIPVALIVSSRFSALMPDLRIRVFLSFLYLNLPNSWEIHANLINTLPHLALLAFMVLSAGPSSRPLWRFFDTTVILLSGLSGPFCIMLTPIAALFWFFRRDKMSFTFFLLTGTCALIQGAFYIMDATRPHMPLGATPELFFKILSSQVFLGALIGQKGLHLISHLSTFYSVLVMIVGIMGLAALINALLKAPLELRLFILFAFLLFIAALYSPVVNRTTPQWPPLSIPGVGGRYWFIPMLAFTSVLVWSLYRSSSPISRMLVELAFVVIIAGIIMDWRYPAFTDFNFREHAHRFESAPIGTQVTIPINPPGWTMTLTKHL
ncbi:MAG TPA: hypothetical protein VN328_09885 [Thermodesulfovibrionales bacterium]|nr:hypothetical protein [Thermodesulfovibrionales bacterium]